MLWVLLLFSLVWGHYIYVLVDCDLTLSSNCRTACRASCTERVSGFPEGIQCLEEIPQECAIQAWFWTISPLDSKVEPNALTTNYNFFVPAFPPVNFRSAIDVTRFGIAAVYQGSCQVSKAEYISSWRRKTEPYPSYPVIDLTPWWGDLIPDTLPDYFHDFDAFVGRYPMINDPEAAWERRVLLSIIFEMRITIDPSLECEGEGETEEDSVTEEASGEHGPVQPQTDQSADGTGTTTSLEFNSGPSSTLERTDIVDGAVNTKSGGRRPRPTRRPQRPDRSRTTTPFPYHGPMSSPSRRNVPYPKGHEESLFSQLLNGDHKLPSGAASADGISGRRLGAPDNSNDESNEEVSSTYNDTLGIDPLLQPAAPTPTFVSSLHLVRLAGLAAENPVAAPQPDWVYLEEDQTLSISPEARLRINCDKTQTCCQQSCRAHCTPDSDPSCLRFLPLDCVVEVVLSHETALSADDWCRGESHIAVDGSKIGARALQVQSVTDRSEFRPVALSVDFFRVYYEGPGVAFDECAALPVVEMGMEKLGSGGLDCASQQQIAANEFTTSHYQASARRAYIDYGPLLHSHHVDQMPRSGWALHFAPWVPAWCSMDAQPTYVTSSVILKYATMPGPDQWADCEEFANVDSTVEVVGPGAGDDGTSFAPPTLVVGNSLASLIFFSSIIFSM